MTLMTYSYPGISTSDASKKGHEIMNRKIQAGMASACGLIDHVNTAVPADALVPGRALQFHANGKGLRVGWFDTQSNQEVEHSLHRHALGQVAAKASLPASFVDSLAVAPEPWKHDLAAHVLNEHFHQEWRERREDASRKTYLVRTVKGDTRAVLSDRYRRIDSRPTLEAFAEECAKVGAQPYEGNVSDTRVSLRAIIPAVFEPADGEILCFGAEWGNSDFGAAKHWFRTFILRLTCLNGATMEDVLSQVHTGSRLSDNFQFSQRTYEMDTRTQVSALRDVVRGALSPKAIDMNLDLLKRANEESVQWRNVSGSLAKRLSKGEQKLVKDAFESEDVINLPAGQSTWRLSNALSWVANGASVDVERKLDLQRMAGEVLNGKRDLAVGDE